MRSTLTAALAGSMLLGLGCQDFQGRSAGPEPATMQSLQMDPAWTGQPIYAGQAAIEVQAPPPQSGKPGNFSWALQGLGTATDPGGAPTPAGSSVLVAPAATAGGTTLTLSTTFYPSCGCTPEMYQAMTITVMPVTSPMTLLISGGSLDATQQETMLVGGQDTFLVSPMPVPPGFSPTWTIQSVTPAVPDAGTLTPGATYASGRATPATYMAPASAPSDFDVVVAASAPDPWFGGTATATATIHVKH
ncbi:MAG TPA: hypothetical protein VJ600_00340 [Holophagaceae bacterium]|nr:hypothetical protein [Holophagaceae bacterium]